MYFLAYFLLLIPVLYSTVDTILPRFYLFDPVKLQQLSRESIEVGGGNATLVMEDLVVRLQKEYGSRHVHGLDKDAWLFKCVFFFFLFSLLCFFFTFPFFCPFSLPVTSKVLTNWTQ